MPYSVGTVSIFYSSGCELMEIFINNVLTLTIEKGQTQSITVPCIKKLEVRCQGKEGECCKGKYQLAIHYKDPFYDFPQKEGCLK